VFSFPPRCSHITLSAISHSQTISLSSSLPSFGKQVRVTYSNSLERQGHNQPKIPTSQSILSSLQGQTRNVGALATSRAQHPLPQHPLPQHLPCYFSSAAALHSWPQDNPWCSKGQLQQPHNQSSQPPNLPPKPPPPPPTLPLKPPTSHNSHNPHHTNPPTNPSLPHIPRILSTPPS
jgi:hypothetical protein